MLLFVLRPTHKAYNILLDAFAISGMVEQARTVFKSMRRDRLVFFFHFSLLAIHVNILLNNLFRHYFMLNTRLNSFILFCLFAYKQKRIFLMPPYYNRKIKRAQCLH